MARSVRLFCFTAILLCFGAYWKWTDDWILNEEYMDALSAYAARNHVAEKSWAFNATRDRDSHSLLHSQCQSAFPDLYHEIDRARSFWTERLNGSKIEPENIDLTSWSNKGGLRVMIYNQQVFVLYSFGLNHFKHWQQRSHGALHQIHRAVLASREPIPNIEFSIRIDDKIDLSDKSPDKTVWTFTRNLKSPVLEQVWIMPDFNFWNYPEVTGSFSAYQRHVMDKDTPLSEKKPSLVWRGTTIFNPGIRDKLLAQTKGRPWSDVFRVDDVDHKNQHRLSMADHCKYRFAAHTEGTTWSGRLKYLLSCHTVAVVHKLSWTTHLYHLLQDSGPDQNHVSVQRNWTDLPEKIEYLLKNETEAQRIADNAASLFRDRYLTPAAQTCYWRQLFTTWSEVAFQPEPYEIVRLPTGETEQRWRGMSYEDYIMYNGNVLPDENVTYISEMAAKTMG